PEENQQNQHDRADQKRREILMGEVGAAKSAALGQNRKYRQREQRHVEPVAPAADSSLHEDHERDADHQRIENEAEFFGEKEIGDGVQIEVAAERRRQIGKRNRPDGVDDSRDNQERCPEKRQERIAKSEIGRKRRRPDQDAAEKRGDRSRTN